MSRANTLTNAERDEIYILLGRGFSLREIGRALKRSPNTVSYEVRQNSTNGAYDPKRAQAKVRLKLRFRRLEWQKIEENTALKEYIVEKLKAHWNPDEIAGRMRKEKRSFYASKTAIYEWLRSARGQRYCTFLYSRRYRKKKRVKKIQRVMIPNRIGIERRFLGAMNRTRYGHFEEDTVVSRKGGVEALAVLSERKSRFLVVRKIPSLSPVVHERVLSFMLSPFSVRSITFDNGVENKNHASLGVPTFFCNPYSSWEKGGVENANKMIRRYFSKGTDFVSVSQEEVDRAVSIINGKPRKILGYRTALEVATKAGIITSTSVLIGG